MAKDFQQIEWDELTADQCRRLARSAVLEDLDRGQDWTTVSLVSMGAVGAAAVVARQEGVIAGLPAVKIVIEEMDQALSFEPSAVSGPASAEGIMVPANTALGVLRGPARSMLTAERLILNFVGRLAGVATLTRKFVDAVAGTKARIYDTRKTTPGWRRLEKYAVRQGGGHNHRTGLFDAVLIKDNHLAWGAAAFESALDKSMGAGLRGASFSPLEAVRSVRQFIAESFPAEDERREMIVEVEVDSLEQLQQVLPEQPDIVLLDNMSLEQLRRAVKLRNATEPAVQLEASGGVSLQTVKAIAETGVDRISSGALTHSAVSLDVALDWLH